MTRSPDPEREMVRRVAPFALPALAVAVAAGWAVGGRDVGVSAGLGIAVVFVNFVAHALSLARAARISLTALYAVGLGGFVVRLAIVVAIMAWLNRFAFFSPLGFGLTVVVSTILLLGYEMKLLAGGVGAELRLPADRGVVE